MAKVVINKSTNEIEMPTLILQNRNFDNIGSINEASDFNYKENFNSPNEASFTVYKDLETIWDDIIDHKIVYIPEYQERFEITVSVNEEDSISKSVTLTSLCEAELGQIILRDIEINTENDIERSDYDENFPTVFYRDIDNVAYYDDIWNEYPEKYKDYTDERKIRVLRQSSLLHRLLGDKCPHYKIGNVDVSLWNIQRTFSISETSVYDELVSEISKEIGCLFTFDSVNRVINVHDLYSICEECGYRGDFTDQCPECGSNNITDGYGEDTTIYIDSENIATSITLETNADSIKNCYYVTGGDDVINAAVRIVNPTGNNYIYRFSDEVKSDMPESLRLIIDSYEKTYNYIQNSKLFEVDDIEAIDKYNELVDYVNHYFNNDDETKKTYLKHICNDYHFTGYSELISAMYDVVDMYGFINDSMLPPIYIDGVGIDEAMQAIDDGFRDGYVMKNPNYTDGNDNEPEYIPNPDYQYYLPLYKPSSAIKSTVESSITKTAKLYCSASYYEISVNTLEYVQAVERTSDTEAQNGKWIGNITLTSLTEKIDFSDDYVTKTKEFTLIIPCEKLNDGLDNDDRYIMYSQQQLQHAVSDKDKLAEKQITSLKLSKKNFETQLKYYSLNELNNLHTIFEGCLNIVTYSNMDDTNHLKELYVQYYNFYKTRLDCIEKELVEREKQIDIINKIYFVNYTYNPTEIEETYYNPSIIGIFIKDVKDALNISSVLGEYYETFCAYRREDAYNNSNYISDGLTNSEIIAMAEDLLVNANREIYKASEPQYTLSSSLNNFLAMKEFQSLKNAFKVGNWIRLSINGKIYKLRLLSYGYGLGDVSSIDVEFSTVNKVWTGYSDIQAVIDSASSMATSYDAVMHQYDKSQTDSSTIKNWLSEGFNATNTKFVNNNNQEVVIDENGILLRKRIDSVEEGYEPYQSKIVSNGLYITSDNWNNIESGIGMISYIDPDNNDVVNSYGVIAKTVVGKLFLGENLKIYNNSGGLKFDDNGFIIENQTVSVSINPNDSEIMKIQKKSESVEKLFFVDEEGNLQITGSLNGGKININNKFKVDSDGNVSLPQGTGIFWVDDDGNENFGSILTKDELKVTNIIAENLKVNSANINGELTATQIASDAITGKDIKGGTIGIGGENYNRFIVDSDGNVSIKSGSINISDKFSVTSSGEITAKYGLIGGWNISDTKIFGGDESTGVAVMQMNQNKSTVFAAGGASHSSYLDCPFRVTKSGELYATKANVNGVIKSTSFTAYGTNNYITTKIGDNIEIKVTRTLSDEPGATELSPYISVESDPNFIHTGYLKVTRLKGDGIYFGYKNDNKFSTVSSLSYDERKNSLKNYVDCVNTKNSLSCEGSLFSNNYVYLNYKEKIGINPEGKDYEPSAIGGIYCPWADGQMHLILQRNASGLNTSIGWNGVGDDNVEYNSKLILMGKTVHLGNSSGETVTSDERLKNSFKPLDEFDDVFMKLEPCAFKYNSGTSGRFHFGTKAQSVRDAFINSGYTTQDFAGFVQLENDDMELFDGIEDPMGLIYSEFTMWNTHMIQKAIKLIETQQNEINELKKLINEKTV